MKYRFLYLAAATFAMVSCSQDETIDINTGKGISFRTETHAGTRATEVSNSNLMTSFSATALQANGDVYFDKVPFSKQENNTYTSTPVYNWPAGNLTFHAVYPLESDLGGATLSFTKDAQTLTSFTVESALADQKDLVYATTTTDAATSETNGVALTFYHQLAQISVQAKATSSAYVYKVKGVKIAQIPSTANLTAFGQTPTWSNFSAKQSFTSDLTNEVTLTGDAVSIMKADDGTAMLIPQQLTAWDQIDEKTNASEGAYLGVLIQITTDQGKVVYPRNSDNESGYAYACVPINTNWEAGYHYVYTLDFSNGAGYVDPEPTDPVDPDEPDQPGYPILGGNIFFTVQVNPWTNANLPDKDMK